MGEGDGDYDYIDITLMLPKFYLNLQLSFYPISGWWWECFLFGDSCWLLRHTQLDLILPTMEFRYQHFYETN